MSQPDRVINNAMRTIDESLIHHLCIEGTRPVILRLLAWFLLEPNYSYQKIVEEDTVFKTNEKYTANRATDDFCDFKKKLGAALKSRNCSEVINKKRMFLILKKHCYVELTASGNGLKGLMRLPSEVRVGRSDVELVGKVKSYFEDDIVSPEEKAETFNAIKCCYETSKSLVLGSGFD
jgi:hypothetical protein